MTAGRLQEKNGYFYMVLSYTASDGKRKQPWVETGLPVKGNKKKAEQMLRELRKSYASPKAEKKDELHPDMLFSDYMLYWLKIIRSSVQETTWSSYSYNVKYHIVPYFEQTGVTLSGLQPRQIQSYYLYELETLKAATVLRLHANLHKALKYAVRLELIAGNSVDKVERPKPEKYIASYYNAEEMEELFEAVKGHKLELIIQLSAFYGLRRGEVLGLRWEAVDFEANTLTIRHIVTNTNINGKHVLVQADRAKTQSSLRTLPLVETFAQRLKVLKEQQTYNETVCGNCYNPKYKGYIFVNEMGDLILPNTVTEGFSKLLADNGLRKIRFHDLRHSCASLLLKHGVPMKQIQEWLGHSDISTTANIYAHLDSQSKQRSAETMSNTLSLPEGKLLKQW
ncbi:tyrosine-type recombinase/integrase [Massiliimalia timonensis]|uniref:tyrosine-type recombinase/integrase n=1 Tax=Massiliimalia timonensis TaxID=1987501 RepID=UPI00189DBCB9|nr:site-specific integrase [Massiliimalia timonensis]